MEHRHYHFRHSTVNDFPEPSATAVKYDYIPGHGYMRGYGTTVPTDADTDWGTGATFVKTDGTTLDNTIYQNIGDKDSCNFDAQVNS